MKLHTLCEDHLYRKAYKNGKKYVGKKTVVYSLRDLKAEQLKRENPQKKKINRIGITVTVKLGSARCPEPRKADYTGGLQANYDGALCQMRFFNCNSGKRRLG